MNHHAGNHRGFTLVEIVIAMAIMALVSGTVMAILMQAGDVAADIRDTDSKDEEIARFLELLKDTVEALPVDASIEMVPASDSVSGMDEMKITNAVGAFLFGEDIGTAGELVIGLQPSQSEQAESGTFDLAISRDSFSPEDTDGDGMVFNAGGEDFLNADSEGRYWLPLVGGILSAQWRYYDEDSSEWLTEWEGENLPVLMEFTLEDSHRSAPIRMVLEIPGHLVTGDGTNAADATTGAADEAQTSSSVSRSRPGGQDGQPNGVRGGQGKGFRGKGRPPGGRGGGPTDGRPGAPGGGRPGGAAPSAPSSGGGGR